VLVKTLGDIVAEYPYSIEKFKRDYANVSFPGDFSEELLASYGVFTVSEMASPNYNADTHKIAQWEAPRLIDGAWVLSWDVTALNQEDIDNLIEQAAFAARETRNQMLADTDYWGLADQVMTVKRREYRQALRDVPQQPGFPKKISWPTEEG